MTESAPLISVVIPARDEQEFLPRSLAALKLAAARLGSPVEYIVVLNRSGDRTEQIALDAGCRVLRNDAKNLAAIRNTGCNAARGRYLLTVDADSYVSPNMFLEIERALSRQNVVGGAVLMLPERYSLGILLSMAALLPIAAYHRISGGLFFCRLADFQAIGGFNEDLYSVEDIDFAVRLKAHGRRERRKFVILLRAYIVTSCRKFDRFGDWYMLRHPLQFISLLRGRNKELADRYWYDFKR